MRRLLSSFMAMAAVTGAVGLATSSMAATQPTLKWTAVFDATGPAGPYGSVQKNAFELAISDIQSGKIDTGNQPISIALQDSATSPAQVINIIQPALADGASFIIGPTLSSEFFKAAPLAVGAHVPEMGVSTTANGIPALGPCVYRDALSEAQIVPDVVKGVVAAWHAKTAAIVYGDDDSFTKSDYTLYNAALQRAGIRIADVETFHKGDVDFRAQLTKVKQLKPDIVVYGADIAEGAKLLEQAHELGMTAHTIGGNGFNTPKVVALAGKAADGVVVGSAWYSGEETKGNQAFVSAYKARFGQLPDQFAAQAYAGVQIAAAAVKRSHPANAAAMCEALRNVGTVETVVGPFRFAPSRDADAHGAVVQIKNGVFVKFEG
ncbi:ABC transporter substrate-binding protein [bacterium]|nr:MAG: ABC transporter substrate-binding protein [bacterium]